MKLGIITQLEEICSVTTRLWLPLVTVVLPCSAPVSPQRCEAPRQHKRSLIDNAAYWELASWKPPGETDNLALIRWEGQLTWVNPDVKSVHSLGVWHRPSVSSHIGGLAATSWFGFSLEPFHRAPFPLKLCGVVQGGSRTHTEIHLIQARTRTGTTRTSRPTGVQSSVFSSAPPLLSSQKTFL